MQLSALVVRVSSLLKVDNTEWSKPFKKQKSAWCLVCAEYASFAPQILTLALVIKNRILFKGLKMNV